MKFKEYFNEAKKLNWDQYTDEQARKIFERKILALYPNKIIMYHETPLANLESIKREGLEEGYGVFGTLGKQSNFVKPPKAILKIEIPSRFIHNLTRDMRYESFNELLNTHQGVEGADVCYSDDIPTSWITKIEIKK